MGAIRSTKIQTGPTRRSHFFETFLVGQNRSIEVWTEISGNFGWMDRAQYFHVPFYRRSSILEGICILIRLYEYTKIKSPDSGKITSLPRSQDVKRDQLRASLISSPKINRVAFTYKVSRHDSSQFPRSSLGTPGSPTSLLCPKWEEEKRLADYDSRCWATSSTKEI